MKKRIADHLIRIARRIDPNSCLDFHSLPQAGHVVISAIHTCVGGQGHSGPCCSGSGDLWNDPRHGGGHLFTVANNA